MRKSFLEQQMEGKQRRDTIRETCLLADNNLIIAAHYNSWRHHETGIIFEEALLNMVIDLDKMNKELQSRLEKEILNRPPAPVIIMKEGEVLHYEPKKMF